MSSFVNRDEFDIKNTLAGWHYIGRPTVNNTYAGTIRDFSGIVYILSDFSGREYVVQWFNFISDSSILFQIVANHVPIH